MTAKELKNALLQEAVQGKLVPQIASEGNARDLLEEIRKEKLSHGLDLRLEASLAINAKSGKRKSKKETALAGSNPCDITEDEIPFDIPENWCWCRLGEISTFNGGYAFKSGNYVTKENGVRVLRISDFDENGIKEKNPVYYPFNTEMENYKLSVNDIIMCMTGGTVGKSYLVKILNEEMYVNQRVADIKCPGLVDIDYIYSVILSHHIQASIQDNKNSTNDNISAELIRNFIIPLPPLAEQKRIVAAIEKFMPLIEEYGKKETELKALNEQIGTLTKKAILQEAVQGKLVPQIAAEGNAKDLLEEIKKEKVAGKASSTSFASKTRTKELSPITEDEIPFDIPESWCWCRLKSIADVFYGFPLNASKFNNDNNGKMIVRIRDIKPAISNTFTTEEIPQEYSLHKNDMLVGMDGNFNVNFWPIEGALLNQRVCKITTNPNFYEQKFLFYILPMFLDEISENVSYCTVKHLSDKHLSTMYLPLPPLAEQKRIVAAIEKMLPLCEKLGE